MTVLNQMNLNLGSFNVFVKIDRQVGIQKYDDKGQRLHK